MIILHWNARGIARKGFKNNLRHLIREHDPPIIVLTKIRIGRNHTETIISQLGFDCHEIVDPIGFAGGIIILWRSNRVQFNPIHRRDQMIHGIIKRVNMGNRVRVSGVCWWFVVAITGFGENAKGYPMEDLVDKLPGQPKVGFKQFAGYVDVDVNHGRSLFYYFVEADKDPRHKPLALWLNGGCSSIGGGAFTELGPFVPLGNGRGLGRNSMSWNRASNLLFVDSPAGVGWSYSNTTSDYNVTDASIAMDMVTFLLNWFDKFPEFKTRDLFLAGESYAGHYLPQLAVALLDHNAHSTKFKFNLKGVAMGNPLLKYKRNVPAVYEFYWSHGMLSDEVGLAIMNQCNFEDYTFDTRHNESESCNHAIEEADEIVSLFMNQYDVLLDVCYPQLIVNQARRFRKMGTQTSLGVDVCMDFELENYLNLPEVQKALHANTTNLPYEWALCNDNDIVKYNESDMYLDMLPVIKRILSLGIPVWVFSGDQDTSVPFMGTRSLVRELAEDLNFKMTVPYGAWFHKKQVAGWATEYGGLLTFATVKGGAHEVAYSQPSRALHLFSSFVRGRRLPSTTKLPGDN